MSDESILKAIKAHLGVNHAWLALREERIVEPDLDIVDCHHHLWDMPGNRYLLDEAMVDFRSGHKIVASVHMQCHSMYRTDGPPALRPVGETEFAAGIAQRVEHDTHGAMKLCAGIVGTTDLMLGERAAPVLEAHLQAGGARFKGIRPSVAWHESPEVRALDIAPHILMEKQARAAIACLDRLGLSLDVWVFFTQLDELLDVCRAFPNLTVIVNHAGGQVGIGPYADKRDEVFAVWRAKLDALAQCPNVYVKLGGLAMRYSGFAFNTLPAPPSSDLLVEKWRPTLEACIEAFGPSRCMFESNFPIDRGMCNYPVLWNAYKKFSRQYSPDERRRLFVGTAADAYRLTV